ncbi:MAG: ion transporter [Mariprofundus sp.]
MGHKKRQFRPDFTTFQYRSRFQKMLNDMLFDVHNPLGRRVNLSITALIVVSVLISMAGTLKGLDAQWVEGISRFEMWVTVLFTLEFMGRCYAARSMRAYLFSFYGLVDLLAVLPMLLIGDPNMAIRLLRIVRLLKLVRYLRAMRLFLASMADTLEVLLMVVGSIALGAILAGNVIYTLEPETFSSAFEGAWWGIVTMTTVGYGDVVPHTLAGRMIAICLMVVGICLFAAVTGVVSVKVARVLHHGMKCRACDKSMAPEYTYCPYCGVTQADPETEKSERKQLD